MVYDNSITKHYDDSKILAVIVSHSPEDNLNCHILAINLAALFHNTKE